MPHPSKFRSDDHPPRRPGESAGEFVAPTGPARARGAAGGGPVPQPSASLSGAATEESWGSRSAPARHDELKLCGLAAVKARFARDPGSIKRLFFDHAMGQRVGVICKVLAREKKVYRQVEPAELEKISGSVHHGGIVAVVYAAPLRVATPEHLASWARKAEPLLVLDRIGNAHNLGAIVRTAAFFGVPRLVIPDDPGAARPNDAAHRVAEGGFEHLEVWQTKNLVTFAAELRDAGYEVIGAATRGGRLEASRGKERAPLALLLGNEESGLAPALAAACTRVVTIPGHGQVESLNVSVAAAVLMWELFARR